MTDYWAIAEDMTAAVAGHAEEVIQRVAVLAQTNFEAGIFATQGTVRSSAAKPSAAGDVTEEGLGLTEFVRDKPEGTNAHYDSGEMMRVVRKGRVWVPVEDSATEGQFPFVRITAKATPLTNEAVGRLRSDADGADSGVATECTRMKFLTTQATAGGLALVEVNLV